MVNFTDIDLISLSCITNQTTSNSGLNTSAKPTSEHKKSTETKAMEKVGNKLIYYKDLATDAEMTFNEDANIFIFKGTNSIQDWKENLSFFPVDLLGIKIHRGFVEQFKALLPVILKHVDISKTVVFTGHSLGGALAQIAAFYFHKNGYSVKMCTFGAPRSGTGELYDYYQKTNIDSTAYFQYNDPIPLLPKRPFKHPEIKRYLIDDKNKCFINCNTDKKMYFFYRWNFVRRMMAWFKTNPWELHNADAYRKNIEIIIESLKE